VRCSLIILVVLLAGCVPPPEIDPAVRADLRTAIATTVAAMQLPADQQPSDKSLDDSAGLLSIQSPPQRQQAIREGRIDHQTILCRGRDSMAQLAHDRVGLRAPVMLVWLVEHDVNLDVTQLLLTDALTAQLRREAHLDK